ncbi:MAG: orotidine 5'-phosphate decarboxylase [Candidatus Undinarchaeales archaeon]|jgi:bifunctional enzyme Fae/Hps|nr:orotidine 5'-phosphate decarboxylase [Candidatus Undinarchaeales archaeon]
MVFPQEHKVPNMDPSDASSPAGQRLAEPPYLQVALDLVDDKVLRRVVEAIPADKRIILEAGTPLIKRFGVGVMRDISAIRPDAFIIADLKTLDVGKLEVAIAAEQGAHAAAVSALAPVETVEAFIDECKERGLRSYVDMMNVSDPAALVSGLSVKPDVVLLHRGIDAELGGTTVTGWGAIPAIKRAGGEGMLVAVAGGITPETAPDALAAGADVLVIGRAITAADDVNDAAQGFLRILGV